MDVEPGLQPVERDEVVAHGADDWIEGGAGLRPAATRRGGAGVREDIAMKPIINLDEVEFDDVEENGIYTSQPRPVQPASARAKLGYNLTELPPGKVQCPFHSHRGEEEMFLILDGEGELRFGDARYPIRRHDVIACPTGGAEVAHQIVNTGTTTMRYLALSNLAEVDACEYPDSGKVSVVTAREVEPGLYGMFRTQSAVAYYDGEEGGAPT